MAYGMGEIEQRAGTEARSSAGQSPFTVVTSDFPTAAEN